MTETKTTESRAASESVPVGRRPTSDGAGAAQKRPTTGKPLKTKPSVGRPPAAAKARAGKQSERVGKQSERVGKQSERVGKQSERVGKQSERVGKQSERKSSGPRPRLRSDVSERAESRAPETAASRDANADYALPERQETSAADEAESTVDDVSFFDQAVEEPVEVTDESANDASAEPSVEGADTPTLEMAPATDVVDVAAREPEAVSPARSGWFRRHATAVAVVMSGALMAGSGAAGYVFAETRPDVFQAEAEVVLQSPASQIDRYLGTQVVMAMSSSVVARAAEQLPLDRDAIDEELDVEPIGSGVALRFSFDDGDPDLARDVVDAVVSAYLTESQTESTSTTRAVYSARIEELRDARAAIEADLERVESANAAAEALELPPPNATEERRLSLESTQLLEQISGLESQLLVTDIQLLNEDQAVVVTPAQILPDRVAPAPLTFAALGILAGGVVAATLVFLLGLVRRPRRSDDA